MTVTAYIALGSNLGDRRANLERGLQLLRERPGITLCRVSSYHETAPVGGPAGQGLYLNAAAELHTDLPAERLLEILLEVELACGRVRHEQDGPRTLDLDLLFYGDLCCATAQLTLPHPRMNERLFVLAPLADIAPDLLDPRSGRTVRDMLVAQSLAQGRELTGLRALVTGSTSGIGRAIALELARAGAGVVIHGVKSSSAAEAVATEARNLGVTTHVHLADLREVGELMRLVQDVWKKDGPIDIWINNAGADTLTGEAAKWPFDRKLQELWAVDVQATLLLARAVGERMKARGSGVIVNMGWDQAETGMEGDSGQLFAAVKAAVMAFSKSLALTLAPEVRVNCLAPGWIQTAWARSASQVWHDRVLRETPLRRWGTPQDVAAVTRWLVSGAAAYVTGQVVRINGGAVR